MNEAAPAATMSGLDGGHGKGEACGCRLSITAGAFLIKAMRLYSFGLIALVRRKGVLPCIRGGNGQAWKARQGCVPVPFLCVCSCR